LARGGNLLRRLRHARHGELEPLRPEPPDAARDGGDRGRGCARWKRPPAPLCGTGARRTRRCPSTSASASRTDDPRARRRCGARVPRPGAGRARELAADLDGTARPRSTGFTTRGASRRSPRSSPT
jgi:hypothetical protein